MWVFKAEEEHGGVASVPFHAMTKLKPKGGKTNQRGSLIKHGKMCVCF
jgi:hypothetical protein